MVCKVNNKILNEKKCDRVQKRMKKIISLLSEHHQRGKLFYNYRMNWRFLVFKLNIFGIKNKSTKKEYREIYSILKSVYNNKNVSDLQKAMYAKTILKLLS